MNEELKKAIAVNIEGVEHAIGKVISEVKLRTDAGTDYDALIISLADGSRLKLSDQGQDCCETRYMRTDDTLPYYVGAEFRGAEIRDAPSISVPDSDGEHEMRFLVIHTTRGDFVISSHNEHNGYYGGFSIVAEIEKPEELAP